jgi:hypothetical protein
MGCGPWGVDIVDLRTASSLVVGHMHVAGIDKLHMTLEQKILATSQVYMGYTERI